MQQFAELIELHLQLILQNKDLEYINKNNIETKERLNVALKNSKIIVGQCDLELKYTWLYNPHPDFKPEACIGKTDDELADNEGTLALKNLKKEVIDTGKGKRKKIMFSLSDANRYYDVTAEPLLDSNGKIKGTTTVSTDITELKEMEQYLINLEKLNTVSQLSYGICHEFKNILQVIMGTAKISLNNINRGVLDNNKLQHKLNMIIDGCEKAEKISSDLINMVKPDKTNKEKLLIQNIIDYA